MGGPLFIFLVAVPFSSLFFTSLLCGIDRKSLVTNLDFVICLCLQRMYGSSEWKNGLDQLGSYNEGRLNEKGACNQCS